MDDPATSGRELGLEPDGQTQPGEVALILDQPPRGLRQPEVVEEACELDLRLHPVECGNVGDLHPVPHQVPAGGEEPGLLVGREEGVVFPGGHQPVRRRQITQRVLRRGRDATNGAAVPAEPCDGGPDAGHRIDDHTVAPEHRHELPGRETGRLGEQHPTSCGRPHSDRAPVVPAPPVTWCWMPGPFMATGYRRPGCRHRRRADLGGGGEKDDPSGTIPECLLNVAH